MANIKSAAKRARQSIVRTARNRNRIKTVRTFEKKLRSEIEKKNKEGAATLLKTYMSQIDRAAKKGVVHKNLAARKIERLSRQVSAIA